MLRHNHSTLSFLGAPGQFAYPIRVGAAEVDDKACKFEKALWVTGLFLFMLLHIVTF